MRPFCEDGCAVAIASIGMCHIRGDNTVLLVAVEEWTLATVGWQRHSDRLSGRRRCRGHLRPTRAGSQTFLFSRACDQIARSSALRLRRVSCIAGYMRHGALVAEEIG